MVIPMFIPGDVTTPRFLGDAIMSLQCDFPSTPLTGGIGRVVVRYFDFDITHAGVELKGSGEQQMRFD